MKDTIDTVNFDIEGLFERYKQSPESHVFVPLADACRKLDRVEEALEILKLSPRVPAEPMSKTIRSAMHNMVNKKGGTADAEDMVVKTVQVDEGRTLYRIRPRAQGRAFRIRKRSSHIKVVVAMPDKE